MARRRRERMSEGKKNIIAGLIQEYDIKTAEDIQEALKDLLGGTIQEMMEAELDFMKATVLSKSMEPVTMYSDMPLEEMAKDPEFPKKWMFGLAMMLKKGLHLNTVHSFHSLHTSTQPSAPEICSSSSMESFTAL